MSKIKKFFCSLFITLMMFLVVPLVWLGLYGAISLLITHPAYAVGAVLAGFFVSVWIGEYKDLP